MVVVRCNGYSRGSWSSGDDIEGSIGSNAVMLRGALLYGSSLYLVR